MNCWHCDTELIWGGDHDIEHDIDEENILNMILTKRMKAMISLPIYPVLSVIVMWRFIIHQKN